MDELEGAGISLNYNRGGAKVLWIAAGEA